MIRVMSSARISPSWTPLIQPNQRNVAKSIFLVRKWGPQCWNDSHPNLINDLVSFDVVNTKMLQGLWWRWWRQWWWWWWVRVQYLPPVHSVDEKSHSHAQSSSYSRKDEDLNKIFLQMSFKAWGFLTKDSNKSGESIRKTLRPHKAWIAFCLTTALIRMNAFGQN